MRISWIRTAAAAMAALALAGCGSGERPRPRPSPAPAVAPPAGIPAGEASPESRAGSIRSRLSALETVEGRTTVGDADATWIAYLADGQPVYILETLQPDDLGSGVEEFFFENGRIFFFSQERTAREASGEGSSREDAISLRLAFGSDGRVVTSFKTINGHRVDTAALEAEGARDRGALLFAEAKKVR